ncbi:MAG: response regulator transcription factor [Bacteroidales bacterium]|nr:response regulator transcription factor [Bacteroidales bacterium]
MSKLTFIIANKSFIVRRGLVSTIEELPNFEVVKEVENEINLFKAIDKLTPDFVIINFEFYKSLNIINLNLLIEKRKTKIIKLVDRNTDNDFFKETDFYIDINESKSSIVGQIKDIATPFLESENISINNSILSNREKDVLRYIALGFTNKEVADKLFISIHTVVSHRKNITKKLDIHTVSGLTIYAVLNKIIDIKSS